MTRAHNARARNMHDGCCCVSQESLQYLLEAAVGKVGLAVLARRQLESELSKTQADVMNLGHQNYAVVERESEFEQQLAVAQAAMDVERSKVASAQAAVDAEMGRVQALEERVQQQLEEMTENCRAAEADLDIERAKVQALEEQLRQHENFLQGILQEEKDREDERLSYVAQDAEGPARERVLAARIEELEARQAQAETERETEREREAEKVEALEVLLEQLRVSGMAPVSMPL